MDNFITQIFKEGKKSRFDASNKKLLKNVANFGGDKGTCLFVNRNGEYNGIVIELLDKVYPLYLDIPVHSIYLNIESNYTGNLEIIEKFNLSLLYQEYSNELFRFVVDEYLINSNLKPIYSNYPKITSNINSQKIIELKKKIKYDTHDLIPSPIKVISTGELLPEDWIGKIFDSGESFHKSIDNLDSRINKPPVTYLANYCMEYVKDKKIPELTELKELDKLKNVWVQDIQTGKFIQYTGKTKLNPEIKNYIQIDCLDKSNPLYILVSLSNTFDQSNAPNQSNSIGFNVSLMQKSFRRGIEAQDNLIESIKKLSKTKPYNNPEYQYELVSGSRQLVWRYFISIIEDIQIYKSEKYLDIFDLVIYSYIFHNYPKFIINSTLVTKLIDLGKLLLILDTNINFRIYPEDNSNKYDLNSRYQISLGISHNYMPGMKGDKRMIRCLLTFIKSKPKLFPIDQLEGKFSDYIKQKEQTKYTDLIYRKIGYYAGLDLHSNPQMIVQVHNVLYSMDKKKSIDLETCSGLIWDTSSSFNYRYNKMKWNKLNDLLYLIQYNWINPQIDPKLLKLSDDYTNKLWTGEFDLNINLSNLEWKTQNCLIDYNKLIYTKDGSIGRMIKPNHICQILLSSQFKNNFWYSSKKTQPIYTNDQIKFKHLDNIIGFESEPELYEKIFIGYFGYLKTYSVNIENIEYKVSVETKNDLNWIKINGIECIRINLNKTIEYLESTYQIVKLQSVFDTNLDLDSSLYKILSNLINCSSSQINTFIDFKSIIKLQQKPNHLVKSNILTNISPEIKQILLSRVLTSLEDKLDRTTLIIGQIDRTGKSNGDSVDSESEGYLLRLFNIFAVMFGCFHRVSEYKFHLDTRSPVFRYWLESMGYQFENTFNKKTFQVNKEKNKIIKTKLWEHQIKVRDMITGNIIRFNQKGFGDASEVGSGKTLTALSVIEFINNLTPNANYLVLVPNTNLYQVWVDEIKSHCENVYCYTQESDGKWVNSINNQTNSNDCVRIYVSTMGRNRDNQLTKEINFVIIDECLSVQNKESKWTIKAFEQVVRAKYGVLMLSATFFRTRFDKLFFMLKMLNTGLPTKSEYLDTILNTGIGANIKTNRIKWDIHTNKIKMGNKFYSEYNGNKIADKFESYIKLKKYLNTYVKFQDLIKPKITELLGLGRKILLYVESQTQLEEFEEYVQINKLEWGFYPNISKDVCILSKHKGTYGINNLIGYNTIVMKPPEPDKLPQIKGRLDRPGQKFPILYLEYIVIADTIEELDIVKLELSNNFYRGHIVPLANYYGKYC